MDENSLKGLRALVLEDEVLIALDLEQLLRDLGADDVTVAHNLNDVDPGGAFDVAILDLMLAGQSTIAFASALFARGVPFVFATGRSDTAQLLADLPGVPVVGKPFSSEALVRALTEALGSGAGAPTG